MAKLYVALGEEAEVNIYFPDIDVAADRREDIEDRTITVHLGRGKSYGKLYLSLHQTKLTIQKLQSALTTALESSATQAARSQ